MKLTKELIIALLTKKLGHVPTNEEIWKELTSNSVGLIMLLESMKEIS